MNASEALERAREYVAELAQRHQQDLVLLEHQTQAWPAGWVFFYNDRAYAETGNVRKLRIGTPPFLITADTGTLLVMGTAHSVAHYLKVYDQHGTCHPERTPQPD